MTSLSEKTLVFPEKLGFPWGAIRLRSLTGKELLFPQWPGKEIQLFSVRSEFPHFSIFFSLSVPQYIFFVHICIYAIAKSHAEPCLVDLQNINCF